MYESCIQCLIFGSPGSTETGLLSQCLYKLDSNVLLPLASPNPCGMWKLLIYPLCQELARYTVAAIVKRNSPRAVCHH